ncbi:hypothetical protein Tcan_18094 [Toxocara canis]|uniref:Uncharacterized protein n=1 Tax=Toxocara canis TaxID=6265 RepID=A0A0B2UYI7_TOXCA|nr:hypothetical protein Tcan_18103 [Toxocara canis]KHN74234.1 hypothetical protein Tcan_18094 [Toxocara canis]
MSVCVVILWFVFVMVNALHDRYTQFIFRNQELCGYPFSDAQWIPVLDMCTIECDELTELCVGNDELKQQCNKLPDDCVEKIKAFEAKWKIKQVRQRTVPLFTSTKRKKMLTGSRSRSLYLRRVYPVRTQKQIGKTIWR